MLKIYTLVHGNIECHHVVNSSVLEHGVLQLFDKDNIQIDVINYTDLVRIETTPVKKVGYVDETGKLILKS